MQLTKDVLTLFLLSPFENETCQDGDFTTKIILYSTFHKLWVCFSNVTMRHKISKWQIYPSHEIFFLQINKKLNYFPSCTMIKFFHWWIRNSHIQRSGILFHGKGSSCEVDDHNSVYQVELDTILKALGVIQMNTTHYTFLRPKFIIKSLSHVKAAYSQRAEHSLILDIKVKLKFLKKRKTYSHESVDTGIQINEIADVLANETAKSHIGIHSPVLLTIIERLLKAKTIKEW